MNLICVTMCRLTTYEKSVQYNADAKICNKFTRLHCPKQKITVEAVNWPKICMHGSFTRTYNERDLHEIYFQVFMN